MAIPPADVLTLFWDQDRVWPGTFTVLGGLFLEIIFQTLGRTLKNGTKQGPASATYLR
jgi:hypothetical protein